MWDEHDGMILNMVREDMKKYQEIIINKNINSQLPITISHVLHSI